MNFMLNISPDDVEMLNGILDEGINDIKQSSNQIYSSNSNYAYNNKYDETNKSCALRNVLNEIKSGNSSQVSNEGKFSYTGESSNRFNNLNTINKKESMSNSKTNDMYDLKNEIKLLQTKINGLGKNLFNKRNSLGASKDSLSKLNEDSTCLIKKKNTLFDNYSSSKIGNSVSILKNSNSSVNLTKINNNNSKNPKGLALSSSTDNLTKSTVKIKKCSDYKTYCYREAITDWKEKYYKVLKDDDLNNKMLIAEKAKNEELITHSKNLEKKSSGYDKINYKYNKLIDEYEKLLIRYDESDSIRKEQSLLIKTLKNELKVLGKWNKPVEVDEENTNYIT